MSLRRYAQLTDELRDRQCRVLVEVGVWNGVRARELIYAALRRNRRVAYHGFDLFEDLTPELLEQELSKQPPSRGAVAAALARHRRRIRLTSLFRRDFEFELHRGFTRDTLPAILERRPELRADFVWLDGGHRVETIEGDWEHCSRMLAPGGVIFLDDHYDNPELTRQFGCNQLVARLEQDPAWDVRVMPAEDHIPDMGAIRIVRVVRAA